MMNAIRSRHPKYRTKLCRNFASGNCPFGQKCSFLHPASRVNPPPSLLAQQLFNWNALLPQLLTLSNQQGTQKKMPRRSPPRLQGLKLIDEDPSPSTSLLLSTSDCTPSGQMPDTRRSSRRKRYPCRHFVRTGGSWCPAGGQCKFHHDVAALPSVGIPKVDRAPPSETDVCGEGRTISGGVLMGTQLPSPPIIGQEHSEPPRYTEAKLAPYQPTYWPNYTWQPYQPYYATIPATTVVPISATAASSSVVQRSIYPPSQPQAQTVPPGQTRTSLPLGAYEVNGTIYFPTSAPSVPAPASVIYSVPVHPAPYNHAMAPAHPYYVPLALPASYYDIPSQTTGVRPQTSFDPFASEPMMPSELPVIPRLEDYQMSLIQHDVLPLPLLSPSVQTGGLVLTTTTDKPTVTQDHEFPYRPPKNQRMGHTRRISVNIKKQGRANSG